MKYTSAGAFRMALERRLADVAASSGQTVQRLRKVVTFDRYLARLQHVAPDSFTLKGGVALDYRFDRRGRATKDIDMVRIDSEERALVDLQRAADASLGDYFEFQITRTSLSAGGQEAGAHVNRFRLRANLASRVFEDVLLDLNYSGPLLGEPDTLRGSDLLAFADIPPTTIRAIAIEQHVAEKLHALTRTYAGGRSSSRSKDLVDVLLITSAFAFDAHRLRAAINEIFDARRGHSLPLTLPEPSPDWSAPYSALAREVGVVDDLRTAHERAAAFFHPLLHELPVTDWDPLTQHWQGNRGAT